MSAANSWSLLWRAEGTHPGAAPQRSGGEEVRMSRDGEGRGGALYGESDVNEWSSEFADQRLAGQELIREAGYQ